MLKQDTHTSREPKTHVRGRVAQVRNRLRIHRSSAPVEIGLDPETGDVVAFGQLRPGPTLRAKVVRTETLKPLVVKDDFAD